MWECDAHSRLHTRRNRLETAVPDQHLERNDEPSGAQVAAPGRSRVAASARQRIYHALDRGLQAGREGAWHGRRFAEAYWQSSVIRAWRRRVLRWTNDPLAGVVALIGGLVAVTLVVLGLNVLLGAPLPNPGTLYLPLVAMLAYHWGWRHALAGALLELVCVYFFFIAPFAQVKPLHSVMMSQLAVLAFVTGFVLALVQLARSRRYLAERAAGRFAALNRIGNSLTGELHEQPLLGLIAETARELTGAEFAAFTLRPVDEYGRPLVPAEGSLFHLAAVVGVSEEQEALFRRMPLGGQGVLEPIFRRGVPVRVADVLALGIPSFHHGDRYDTQRVSTTSPPRAPSAEVARAGARSASGERLRYIGVPHGHPVARSFLGVPLLDSEGEVRGGLLLGHAQPDHFTAEDQELLVGLAAQAAVSLENARLYRAAHAQAQELDATFESITDGVMLVDANGALLRENGAARHLREALARCGRIEEQHAVLREVAAQTLARTRTEGITLTAPLEDHDSREFVVTGTPLWRPPARGDTTPAGRAARGDAMLAGGAVVVVWHDVSATHRLLEEQRARADAEARQALLRMVIDELPSGVYLVHGPEARLVLANQAAEEVWGATWRRGQTMMEFLRATGTRIFGPDGRELASGDLATIRSARDGTDVRHHQEVIRQANGTNLPILLNAVALDPRALHLDVPALEEQAGEAASQELAALVVLQDVTALKETERLKDEFIGVAAHELRTPLAALKGFVEMLSVQTARGKGRPLDAWQQEALDAIDQATARLVDLIDDLLDVTRLQGGRLRLRLEPHDLVALVRRVVRRLAVTDERHHIEVVAETEYVVACIDPPRVEQIISNLLLNAIKYSPEGGRVTIAVRADTPDGEAVISVRDQGIGIPPAQQALIFGRFIRADNARDRGIAGTGLGLYLCRELVERHGGRIWFDSTEGQGSTFFVALPLNLTPDDTETASRPDVTDPATG